MLSCHVRPYHATSDASRLPDLWFRSRRLGVQRTGGLGGSAGQKLRARSEDRAPRTPTPRRTRTYNPRIKRAFGHRPIQVAGVLIRRSVLQERVLVLARIEPTACQLQPHWHSDLARRRASQRSDVTLFSRGCHGLVFSDPPKSLATYPMGVKQFRQFVGPMPCPLLPLMMPMA